MGGIGSGRHWACKRATVEQCLTLNIDTLDLSHRPCGKVCWYREGKEICAVTYALDEGKSVLTLYDPVRQNVPLVTTETFFGGDRYWFSCPNCRRRVGRLHLPHGKSWFFCRRCWDLTYESCQLSHSFDSFFLKMGVPLWAGRGWLRRSRREMVPPRVYGGE